MSDNIEASTKPRREFLDLALSCGAVLTGKPDGSEAITVLFTIEAWRKFDSATAPATPAIITLNGHQIKAALDLIAPADLHGNRDADELEGDLTFGNRHHRDDDGKEGFGMCCWNDDTDGVLPLDEEPVALQVAAETAVTEFASHMRHEVIPSLLADRAPQPLGDQK